MTDVVLVDAQDREVGTCEKLEAHKQGLLHRAFSIFVLNKKGQLLLQQRAENKYHSGGKWTNTTCSHPMPGEDVLAAGKRRLKEEMGFTCELEALGRFIYKAEFENNLIEHELDHVLIGRWEGELTPDREECQAWRWIDLEDLKQEMKANPEKFSAWLAPALEIAYNGVNDA